jgi:hypothetical protein
VTEEPEPAQVGLEDVQQFLQKLDSWASTLNVGDRALLQLIVEQSARRLDEPIDLTFPAGEGVGRLLEPFLRERAENLAVRIPEAASPRRPKSWVQAGDPWIQAG